MPLFLDFMDFQTVAMAAEDNMHEKVEPFVEYIREMLPPEVLASKQAHTHTHS
jgi:hypothetical protein